MLLITGFQNGMSLALVARAPVRLAAEVVCPSPQSSLFDWTSVLLASLSLSCIVGYSLQVESNCVVPKNRAGLSTHAAPCSPLTLKKSSIG